MLRKPTLDPGFTAAPTMNAGTRFANAVTRQGDTMPPPAPMGGSNGAPPPINFGTPGMTDDQASTAQRNSGSAAAGTAYTQSQGAYDQWGNAIDRASGFQPTSTQSLTNGVGAWDPNGGSGATGTYMNGRGPVNAGVNEGIGAALAGRPGGVSAQTDNLGRFSASSVSNYDPSAAVKQYADAAWQQNRQQLGDDLTATQNRDASLGRLNTGFFDKNRGMVMARANSSYTSALADQALGASGQRLSALASGAGMELSRAGQMDTLGTQASIESGRLRSAGVSQGLQGSSLRLQGQSEEDTARRVGAGEYDAGQLARGEAGNAFNLGRSTYLDTARQRAGEFGATQAGNRAGLAQSGYQDARNYASDMTAGRQDREMQRVGMDRANNNSKAQSIINGVGAIANVPGSVIRGVGSAVRGIGSFFGMGG